MKTISSASAESDQVAAFAAAGRARPGPRRAPGRRPYRWSRRRRSRGRRPPARSAAGRRRAAARRPLGGSPEPEDQHGPSAIAAASGIVQRKSVMSGRAKSGRCRSSIEMALVLSPVHEPSPIATSDPIPAARARESGPAAAAPAQSRRLDQQHGGDQRGAEQERDRGEGRRRRDERLQLGRGVRFGAGGSRGSRGRRRARSAGPPARPRRRARSPASAASMTPGRSIGWVGAGVQAVGGNVPAAARAGERSRRRPRRRRTRATAATTTAACGRSRARPGGRCTPPAGPRRWPRGSSQAAKDATTPTIAASTSSPTNCLLRMIAAGSGGEAGAWAMRGAAYWAGLSGHVANG